MIDFGGKIAMVIEMRFALWVSTLVLFCISGLAFSAEYEYGNKALQIWDDHAKQNPAGFNTHEAKRN